MVSAQIATLVTIAVLNTACVDTDFATLCDLNHDAAVCMTDSTQHADAPADVGLDTVDSFTASEADAESSSDAHSGEPCDASLPETLNCGNCGTRSRSCIDGTWSEWSACTGEGVCAPDQIGTSATGCTGLLVHSRTCSSTCIWGDYGPCDWPKGWTSIAKSDSVAYAGATSGVWSGTELLVWGDTSGGAAYDAAANTWHLLPSAPIASRADFAYCWSGKEFVIWGGSEGASTHYADGASYDPVAGTWRMLPASPLTARLGPSGVWAPATGEFVIWGGLSTTSIYTGLADGAAYNPATDSWRTIASAPIGGRWEHVVAWAGNRVVIYGGRDGGCPTSGCTDAATYDPVGNTWTMLPTPPSSTVGTTRAAAALNSDAPNELMVFGGAGGVTGAWLDVSASTWHPMSTPSFDLSADRELAAAWWSNHRFWVFGGAPVGTLGVSYDPTTDGWLEMPVGDFRYGAVSAWMGTAAIVYSGGGAAGAASSGAVFKP